MGVQMCTEVLKGFDVVFLQHLFLCYMLLMLHINCATVCSYSSHIFSAYSFIYVVRCCFLLTCFSCAVPLAWQLSFQAALIGSFRDEWINYRR